MTNTVLLNGIKFLIPTEDEMSLDQDMMIMSVVMKCGLHNIPKTESGGMEEAASLIIAAAYTSGNLFPLLGALIVPEGMEWTPEVCHSTAEMLKGMKSGKDKKEVMQLMSMALAGFFVSGIAESRISLMSSGKNNDPSDPVHPSETTEPLPTSTSGMA